LTEAQLCELLDGVRARARHYSEPELPAVEAALAELESEVAARGVSLPGDVIEPMPPALARCRLLQALRARDSAGAARAVPWIEPGELWLAYQRIRRASREVRTACWFRLLYRLDLLLLGSRRAAERQQGLQTLPYDAEDLEAYLAQCVSSMFALAFSSGAVSEESGEGTCD